MRIDAGRLAPVAGSEPHPTPGSLRPPSRLHGVSRSRRAALRALLIADAAPAIETEEMLSAGGPQRFRPVPHPA